MKYPLLAIDPGLNSCGWAVWDGNSKEGVPTHTGLIKAPRSSDLVGRARWIARKLDDLVATHIFNYLNCEGGKGLTIVSEIAAYHGSALGWAAGDLQKLVFLVGVISGYFSEADMTVVTPAEWKGQLPKKVVIRRLQKRFGPGATQEWEKDVWDAVGIGLWKQGRF